MKRILLGVALIAFTGASFAQDAADKKVQAGLVVGYGMNFQKMGTKLMQSDGVGSDLTLGANVNIGFNDNIGLSTGIEFDFETLKYRSPAGDTVFYFYRDENNTLVETNKVTSTDVLYVMDSRKQKPLYLTIPTMLIFRTNFIGYFRYYGKFGLRTSIHLSDKITDTGSRYDGLGGYVSATNENMRAKNDMFFIKSSVGVAGGAEWNFVGSTCLLAEIGYYYGFTPLHTDRKEGEQYLIANTTAFSNQAKQSQLMFKVSILF